MRVYAVVLNHNNYEGLNRSITAILKNSLSKEVSLNVLVVDTDFNIVKQRRLKNYKKIIFENIKENLGVSKGYNTGFKKALRMGADYILMITPSIVIEKDVIQKLLTTTNDSGIGMISSKVLLPGKTPKIFFMGGMIDPIAKSSIHINLGKNDDKRLKKIVESEFLNCPILIKKEVFEKVGFFDERFFMYYEDIDWHLRARRAGYSLLVNNSAVSWLKKSIDPSEQNYLKDYYITRNLLLFIGKNFNLNEKVKAYYLRVKELLILLRNYLLNRGDKKQSYYKIMGYWDFLKGDFGYRRIP